MNYMISIKILTVTFSLMLTFITSACAGNKDSKSINSQKEKNDMEVIALTKADFLKKVYNYEANPNEWKFEGSRPAIIDFYATWCGPCKVMSPTVEALGKELVGQARILKIDVDKNEAVANLYRIQSVPTLIIFKKGEIVWRTSGVMEKGALLEQIKKFID